MWRLVNKRTLYASEMSKCCVLTDIWDSSWLIVSQGPPFLVLFTMMFPTQEDEISGKLRRYLERSQPHTALITAGTYIMRQLTID